MTITHFFSGNSRVKTLLLHFTFWLIVLFYFSWGFAAGINFRSSFMNILVYMPGFMLLVYTLVYVLVPRYLTRKKYWQFFSGLLLALLICTVYAELAQGFVRGGVFNGVSMREGRGVLPFIHIGGIAISINLLNHWYKQKQQTLEARQQKTAAELELLKSQIHPHFLFNTLNNLYSFVLDNSPAAPAIVLKLSGLLRFMIYESSAAFIPLLKEIELLKEYISLEQLRYGSRLDLSITVKGEPGGKEIPPLLMLPLIENAFKHGTANQVDQCWITLYINITDTGIHFKLLNSMDVVEETGRTARGVGLKNVQRRLELLYPGEYIFKAEAGKEVFIVNLELPLREQEPGGHRVNVADKQLINEPA
ncbi:MAG: histidine kinase [Chitinophagaceae bacterium]